VAIEGQLLGDDFEDTWYFTEDVTITIATTASGIDRTGYFWETCKLYICVPKAGHKAAVMNGQK
jgi:hypothetical protein